MKLIKLLFVALLLAGCSQGPDPKDAKIAALEAKLAQVEKRLETVSDWQERYDAKTRELAAKYAADAPRRKAMKDEDDKLDKDLHDLQRDIRAQISHLTNRPSSR